MASFGGKPSIFFVIPDASTGSARAGFGIQTRSLDLRAPRVRIPTFVGMMKSGRQTSGQLLSGITITDIRRSVEKRGTGLSSIGASDPQQRRGWLPGAMMNALTNR
jgi:hypothetical protein